MELVYIQNKQGVKNSRHPFFIHLNYILECADQSRPGMDTITCELRLGTQSLEAVKFRLLIKCVHYIPELDIHLAHGNRFRVTIT